MNVSLNAISLNRWMMTEILWKRKNVSLGSSDLEDRSLPTWAKNVSLGSLDLDDRSLPTWAKNVSLGSSDLEDRSLPTWAKNESPASLVGPKVSTATGMNMWEEERAEYLAVFTITIIIIIIFFFFFTFFYNNNNNNFQ